MRQVEAVHAPKRQMNFEAKKQAVLDAAAAVFLKHGFSASSTDMIQQEAGVSKATVYACFPSKEQLFSAVIESECKRMVHSVKAIEPVCGNVIQTLYALGVAYLRIVLSPTALALYRTSIAEAPRFPGLARSFYLAGPKTIATLVADFLAQAVRRGEVDVQAIGIDVAAVQFVSLLRGEGQLECLTHPQAQPSAVQVDRWVCLAIFTFLNAYGTGRPYALSSIEPSQEFS